jgi:hypothetical protein
MQVDFIVASRQKVTSTFPGHRRGLVSGECPR